MELQNLSSSAAEVAGPSRVDSSTSLTDEEVTTRPGAACLAVAGVPELQVTCPAGLNTKVKPFGKLSISRGFSAFNMSLDRRCSRMSYATTASPCSLAGPPDFYPRNVEPVWGGLFYLRCFHLVIASLCALLHALSLPHSFDNTVHHVSEERGGDYNCSIIEISQSFDKLLCAAIFPYIAFCSHLIISAVDVLGCMLGQPLPPLLSRAFCFIGGATFLTAAGVNFYRWPTQVLTTTEEVYFSASPQVTLIASAVLALLGAALYWSDAYFSLRRSIKYIESIAPAICVLSPPNSSVTKRSSQQPSPETSQSGRQSTLNVEGVC